MFSPCYLIVMDRIATARRFRQADNLTESRLWELLRNRRLDGRKFRRQVPIGRYFADFACMEARLIVEADGPSHDYQVAHDLTRTQELEALGFVIVRVKNTDVLADPSGVCIRIRQALRLAR